MFYGRKPGTGPNKIPNSDELLKGAFKDQNDSENIQEIGDNGYFNNKTIRKSTRGEKIKSIIAVLFPIVLIIIFAIFTIYILREGTKNIDNDFVISFIS